MKPVCAMLVGALLAAPFVVLAAPPSSQVLMPAESAAKAKDLLQQMIRALGGQAYLDVRDITCTGKFATFDRQEDLGGYANFVDYTKLPDKNRTEFFKKRNIITLYNGDKGWQMDRGGIQDAPADDVADFQESLKKDIDNLLRLRLNEEGLVVRYNGSDLLDLKRVDWVEIVDRDRRTFRIAIEQNTHLPIRAVVVTRDRQTRERIEETTFYANYHAQGGVMTPLQVWKERNGRKNYQAFYEGCQYNTGLADALFTRESLEQRFAELNKGKKK